MTMPPITLDYLKEKWNHAGFQRYFANTSWMFIGRIFVLAISFVVNIYIARYLGPGNFGLLNYTFSIVGLFGILASLGVDGIISREIIKNHGKKDEIIGTSFYIRLFGSVLAILAILIVARGTTDDPMLIGLIGMYSMVYLFNAFGVIDTYFQSQVLSKYPTFIMMGVGVISTVLKIVVMASGAGIIWLVAVYTFESAVTTVGLLYIFARKGHSFRSWRFDRKIAVQLLKDSLPLMLSGAAVATYMDIDQIMIKNILGNEPAGIYAVAVKLSEVWYFIPGVICGSLFPAIVNARQASRELYESRLKKLYFVMFWLPALIALFTTVFGGFLVRLLFGAEYQGAVTALQIYVWGGVAISLGFVVSQYLIAENFTKIAALTAVVGAAVNVGMNIVLIPRYGIEGAAFATLVSYVTVTFSILLFKKTRPHAMLILRSIVPRSRKQDII